MVLTPADFIRAARVPLSLEPQTFGSWTIERRRVGESILFEDLSGVECRDRALPYGEVGFPDYTLLRRITLASLHLEKLGGEIVMEDSQRELRKHLGIWMVAKGRVLKTGLGLGCVVRGLLANPEVEHIDVVEIDDDIVRIIGREFAFNPRVTMHVADALTWDYGDRTWDYAWHDLHSFDETCLQKMHMDLFKRYRLAVPLARQGAWAWPREFARRLPLRLLGTPKFRGQSRARRGAREI